ncbi:MAG: hypothetical protein FJ405_15955, partial [Verrucomicrobia bacterium]|nr:hypothetical protein [Verrucomicrobiota bacterium]
MRRQPDACGCEAGHEPKNPSPQVAHLPIGEPLAGMPPIQEIIHSLEQGAGRRWLLLAVTLVCFLGIGVVMDTKFARNMTTPEGMEAAQLARNIAEGKGYTTGVLRPLSIRLIQNVEKPASPLLKESSLPDLHNPPLYPVLLAGWLKLNPFGYRISEDGSFRLYGPDIWVAIFNQLLLGTAAFLTYRLATRMFDQTAGWLSAGIFASTWLFWQLTFTGHSSVLLMVLSLSLAHCLFRAGDASLGEDPSGARIIRWGIMAGACVGLMALTRYSAAWVIIPVALYLAFLINRTPGMEWSGPSLDVASLGKLASSRLVSAAGAVAVFLLLFGPWVVRNYQVAGAPFGAAGHAIYMGTEQFPGDAVERLLYPDFSAFDYHEVRRKVINNLRYILFGDLTRFAGGWMVLFFLVGLLIPYRRGVLNRFRWFLVLTLGFMVLAMAGGRTPLSDNRDTADISSENLIAPFSPLIFIYGVGLLLTLVDQMRVGHPMRGRLIQGGAALLCSLPMLMAFFPPLPYVTP